MIDIKKLRDDFDATVAALARRGVEKERCEKARDLDARRRALVAETETLKVVLKICKDANALTGLKVSDVEPKFWRQSYEDLLVKTQSFASLHGAGMPPIQCFTFSHLSRDPESDALVYDAYQEELAKQLDAQANVPPEPDDGDGGDVNATIVDAGAATATGTGHPKDSTGICPVCGRTFKKKTNNQVYDRPECRRKGKNRQGIETGSDFD